MRDQEIIGLWEAYQKVYAQPEKVEQLDEFLRAALKMAKPFIRGALRLPPPRTPIRVRAANAVADQRLDAAQSGLQQSMNTLRQQGNSNRFARADAAAAARAVERQVRQSSAYGPQLPKPGTVTGRKIEIKPTGSKPTGQRIENKPTGSNPTGIKLTDGYEYDIYDIILSHLLDEGYAETQEAAKAIMVNMSEEWRQSILG